MTAKSKTPSTNGQNGRDQRGRFTAGNAGGPGNPHAKRVARLRAELLRTVTLADIRAIVKALVKQAKGGDIAAIREVLDRAIGKPVETDFVEKLEHLEHVLDELTEQTK